MKNLIFVLAIFLLAACGGGKSNTSSVVNNTNSPAGKQPAVGDAVVAKYKTGTFAEGKVQSITGLKAKIDWTNTKDLESIDVDLADIYPMPKAGDPVSVRAGDYALANTSSYHDGYWNKVQIANVSGPTITVKETNGSTGDITSDKVIAVSAAEASDIKAMYDKFKKQDDFMERAGKTRPIIPPDYKAKPGDSVVGEAQLGWSSGKVKSVTADKATVIWDPKNNYTFETTLDKIAPYPTAAATALPAVDDLVLYKTGYENVWDFGLVTGISGSNVDVKNKTDQKTTVKPGEYILLKQ